MGSTAGLISLKELKITEGDCCLKGVHKLPICGTWVPSGGHLKN